jgi:hypothetical protein
MNQHHSLSTTKSEAMTLVSFVVSSFVDAKTKRAVAAMEWSDYKEVAESFQSCMYQTIEDISVMASLFVVDRE